MYITSIGYQIEADEKELWTIIFALHKALLDTERIERSKQFYGMKTHESNYGNEMEIMRLMCNKVGRHDVYDEMLAKLTEAFEKT